MSTVPVWWPRSADPAEVAWALAAASTAPPLTVEQTARLAVLNSPSTASAA